MQPLPEETESATKKVRKLTLPRKPMKEAPEIEPHRPFVIRVLRSPLQLTLAVLAVSPLVFLAEAADWKFAGDLRICFVVMILGLIVYYLCHALFTVGSEWFKTQKRLSELMAMILFGASALTLMQSFSSDPKMDLPQHIFFAFGWAALGGTWAWDRMRILGLKETRSRLWMLVVGWLAVPGIMGATFFMFATVILVLEQISARGMPPADFRRWLIWYGCSVCVALAGWPALKIEWALSEKRALKPGLEVEKKGPVE